MYDIAIWIEYFHNYGFPEDMFHKLIPDGWSFFDSYCRCVAG